MINIAILAEQEWLNSDKFYNNGPEKFEKNDLERDKCEKL